MKTWSLLFLALIFLVVVCVPILIIWALNTLFLLGIPLTFKTWLAALLLGSLVGNSGGSKK